MLREQKPIAVAAIAESAKARQQAAQPVYRYRGIWRFAATKKTLERRHIFRCIRRINETATKMYDHIGSGKRFFFE